MLSEVNKVSKDNPIFVSFLLYFLPTPPLILTPRLLIFQNPWSPPVYFDPPPVYYEPESKGLFSAMLNTVNNKG